MAVLLADRVKETTTSTGTGTINLAGAVTGYQTFVSGVGNSAKVHYAIVGRAGGSSEGEWEVGIGTVTDATPDTLSRSVILASSNSGSAVNFSTGTKDVFLTAPAEQIGPFQDITVSSVATVEFNIANYSMVRIQGWVIPATDNTNFGMRLSNDGGSTFRSGASDYMYTRNFWRLDTSQTPGTTQNGGTTQFDLSNGIGNGSTEGITFDIQLMELDESSRQTTMFMQTLTRNAAPADFQVTFVGSLNTAEVNDAVQFFFSSGNLSTGRIRAWGIS